MAVPLNCHPSCPSTAAIASVPPHYVRLLESLGHQVNLESAPLGG